jgi:3-oxoadipate enol-lactonase
VEDARALLRQLGIDRCCLVGHSLGGFISLEFALRYPEALVGLVLVDTSSGDWDRPADYGEMRVKLDELARSQGMEAAFEYEAANNPVRIERYRMHPEQREIGRRKMLMTSVDGYIHTARAMAKWRPVTDRLQTIATPTLIFWGDEDTPFLEASRALKEGIPNAELITIPGAGHSPHEEAPELFNEKLTAFLSGLEF